MTRRRHAAIAGSLLLLGCAGCAAERRSVAEAFPPGSVASPWRLQGEVWCGTLDEAAAALGNDADRWRELGPTRVWLAVYRHEDKPAQTVTVRCFAFETADAARRAYDAVRPADAQAYEAGDAGCWTEIGVLFQWGRLVLDVFGHDASWGSQVQASLLAAFITKRMPPGAPGNPQ
jgi:hypothetical protein